MLTPNFTLRRAAPYNLNKLPTHPFELASITAWLERMKVHGVHVLWFVSSKEMNIRNAILQKEVSF